MRIVTWNLKHDKGSVVWPRLYADLGIDIILLQETKRPNCGGSLAWENVPNNDWGSAVIVTKGQLCPMSICGYEGWVVGGELLDSKLTVGERPLFVFSIHSPTSTPTHPRRSYVEEVMNILNIISQQTPRNADLVIGGDFNFLSLGNRRDNESLKTTPAECEVLAHFARMGMVSCWSAAHPNQALPQTLRWAGDKSRDKSTPYHCDGIFVPETWRQNVICEVLTSECFKVSDHYPVAAWISR